MLVHHKRRQKLGSLVVTPGRQNLENKLFDIAVTYFKNLEHSDIGGNYLKKEYNGQSRMRLFM